ncbi:hypothetical protein CHELA1G11_12717 [Hyphomicrobiales bacterium]|nr:hypothetical protein CHELA1G2_11589 [Hyphomicrobiales bacterium]CAH1666633.1 hypothetical protein CHELA1G11_12717 [Hyphomicrobiales bacterium]
MHGEQGFTTIVGALGLMKALLRDAVCLAACPGVPAYAGSR